MCIQSLLFFGWIYRQAIIAPTTALALFFVSHILDEIDHLADSLNVGQSVISVGQVTIIHHANWLVASGLVLEARIGRVDGKQMVVKLSSKEHPYMLLSSIHGCCSFCILFSSHHTYMHEISTKTEQEDLFTHTKFHFSRASKLAVLVTFC